jgi:hypothetical protein
MKTLKSGWVKQLKPYSALELMKLTLQERLFMDEKAKTKDGRKGGMNRYDI